MQTSTVAQNEKMHKSVPFLNGQGKAWNLDAGISPSVENIHPANNEGD